MAKDSERIDKIDLVKDRPEPHDRDSTYMSRYNKLTKPMHSTGTRPAVSGSKRKSN